MKIGRKINEKAGVMFNTNRPVMKYDSKWNSFDSRSNAGKIDMDRIVKVLHDYFSDNIRFEDDIKTMRSRKKTSIAIIDGMDVVVLKYGTKDRKTGSIWLALSIGKCDTKDFNPTFELKNSRYYYGGSIYTMDEPFDYNEINNGSTRLRKHGDIVIKGSPSKKQQVINAQEQESSEQLRRRAQLVIANGGGHVCW